MPTIRGIQQVNLANVFGASPKYAGLLQKKEHGDATYLQALNHYGDSLFCEFRIDVHLQETGLYCFMVDRRITFVGSATDSFQKKINNGYGKITPRNCMKGGQAGNCRINALLNTALAADLPVRVGFCPIVNEAEIHRAEKMLQACKFDWNTLH